jgi:ABC-type antimicrobial peptide transport system permease subunit
MRQTAARNTGGLDGILRSLAAVPGVVATAGSTHVPFVGAPAESPIRAADQAAAANRRVRRQLVTPGYFRAMGVPVLRGRPFVGAETHGVVISLELERQLFGGDALGRRVIVEGAAAGTYEIIGIVGDVKHDGFAADDLPSLYLSNALGATVAHIVVRTSAVPGRLLPQLTQAARGADARMIVTEARTMDALASQSVAEAQLRAMLSSVFGGAALLLAALGLYGLAARLVIDRRQEIAIRMALGARPVHVRTLVLQDGLAIVGAGLAAGLPAAFAGSHLLRAFLFGVSATAPHVFLLGAGVLAAVACVAMIVPARRASRAPIGGQVLN